MKILLVAITILGSLFANKLTIYNNFAYVDETKKINLKAGINKIEFENFPKSAIIDSIMPIIDSNQAKIIMQEYQYNPFTTNNLLKANLNKEVDFIFIDTQRTLTGKLINITPPTIKDEKGNIYLVDSKNIIFKNYPKNIDKKEKIVWKVHSKNDTNTTLNLKYLIDNIYFSTHYNILLNKNSLTLNGFAKVTNKSSKDFKNYKISLIAGDINKPITRSYKKVAMHTMKAAAMEAPATINKLIPTNGYYRYNIPFKINLSKNQSKDILYIALQNIKYKKYGMAYNSSFYRYSKEKLSFNQVIEFKNVYDHNKSIPLPKGVVRVYSKDSYLGQNYIQNTPKNSTIKLTIGKFFDISGSKKITKYVQNRGYKNVETSYEIKNLSKEIRVVKIKEDILRGGVKVNYKSSCENSCQIEKIDAFKRIYTIKLAPNSKYNFKSEYEIFY